MIDTKGPGRLTWTGSSSSWTRTSNPSSYLTQSTPVHTGPLSWQDPAEAVHPSPPESTHLRPQSGQWIIDRFGWEPVLLWAARMIIIVLIVGGAALTMVTLNPLWTAAGTLAGWWVLATVRRAHGGRWALPGRGLVADIGHGLLLAAGGVLLALPGARRRQRLPARRVGLGRRVLPRLLVAIIVWGLCASGRWTR